MSKIKGAIEECEDCLRWDIPLPDCTVCEGSGWVWKFKKEKANG